MKKMVIMFSMAMMWLIGCYIIGQYNHRENNLQESTLQGSDIYIDYQSETVEESPVVGYADCIFEGVETTDDNPWGYTAGLISDDEVGESILLTPNTSVMISPLYSNTLLHIQMRIHPWIASGSDGAGVDIWLMNDVDEIIYQDAIEIPNNSNWIDLEYAVNELGSVSKMKILCNNGNEDNDNSDWVVIKLTD